jgi:hypothetical protein
MRAIRPLPRAGRALAEIMAAAGGSSRPRGWRLASCAACPCTSHEQGDQEGDSAATCEARDANPDGILPYALRRGRELAIHQLADGIGLCFVHLSRG